jgi:type 2 lantibiotic biosynthesis protein LanM
VIPASVSIIACTAHDDRAKHARFREIARSGTPIAPVSAPGASMTSTVPCLMIDVADADFPASIATGPLLPLRNEGDVGEVALTGPPAAPAPRSAFLSAACRVGDRLEQLAFRTDTDASWIGVTSLAAQHGQSWSLAPLGLDLYGGVPGIALFLSRLASIGGEPRYDRLAREATANVLRQLNTPQSQQQQEPQLQTQTLIGAFAGLGGVIYALTHVGLLLRDPALIERAERLVSPLHRAISADRHFDLMSGSAGAILGLASLHAVTGSSQALAAIRAAAEHLVAFADIVERGGVRCRWRWRNPSRGEPPLACGTTLSAGCAHGDAAIALALLTAWSLTKEARFERTARAAIAYERAAFSRELQESPGSQAAQEAKEAHDSEDRRRRTAAPRSAIGWCHGPPGLGLARLAGLRYADDSHIRDDIAGAVHAARLHGFGRDHCLCHGDLGRLELLATAAVRVDEPGLRASVACFGGGILRSIRAQGWRCGLPFHIETPGLMIGLAGIGDGLLRIAEPRLPSILTLQPP